MAKLTIKRVEVENDPHDLYLQILKEEEIIDLYPSVFTAWLERNLDDWEAGDKVCVFHKTRQITMAVLVNLKKRQFKILRWRKVHHYVPAIEQIPLEEDLIEMLQEPSCTSPSGEIVEHDGIDMYGFPSWTQISCI